MIIDFRVYTPTREGYASFLNPGPHLQRYAEVFATWRQPESALMTPKELVQLMDRDEIDKVVLFAYDAETTYGPGAKFPNEKLAEYCADYPDRLIALAGADPHKGMKAIREFEYAIKNFGMKGLNMGPWLHKIYASDPKYYPFYAKCVELNVPVVLHTSMNFSPDMVIDSGRPLHLDPVARYFPELKIVASHGGWPWVLEMIGVLWRHKNVYIDISAVRTRYLNNPGNGWEPLLAYGGTFLSDRVLFATDYPILPFKRSVEEVRALPIKDEVKEQWLWKNAARVLGLDL
ncbi:MAG: amidohydrolase [Chloroflexi bacterium]|nr:amidohydrolase [Chloroflexota bacterium]